MAKIKLPRLIFLFLLLFLGYEAAEKFQREAFYTSANQTQEW